MSSYLVVSVAWQVDICPLTSLYRLRGRLIYMSSYLVVSVAWQVDICLLTSLYRLRGRLIYVFLPRCIGCVAG